MCCVLLTCDHPVRRISYYVWHDSFLHVTWLVSRRDMTHSCVGPDLFFFVPWERVLSCWSVIVQCDMTHFYVWHDSLLYVTWLIPMCNMTHFCGCHENTFSAAEVWSWVFPMCNMSHSYKWHDDSCTCVTWLIFVCAMTHPHVWRDFFWHAPWECVLCCWSSDETWLIYICGMTRVRVTWLIRMCDMTYS